MKYTNLLIVWLLVSSSLYAQNQNWQQQYVNAKAFYKEGKFALAMESFKPLIEEAPGNYFSTYSSFYYALAAYKSNYLPLSKNMLLQIKNKYPTWSKMDEVNFWLAIIYFDEEAYNQALNSLNEIKAKKEEKDVENLKYNYLSKIESIDILTGIYENHPDDKVVGELLAKKITEQALVNQDQKMLDDIIEKFKFNPAKFNVIELKKTVYKDKYKVAVILPFMAADLQPNERKKVNQFVLDLYQGIELAADTLKAEGINIELFAYDTKRSEAVTRKLMEDPELKGMDLIIGPIYSHCVKVVNEFSYKNRINVINPISSNAEVIGQNPFSFLFSPSNETIGRKSAEYVLNNINKKPGIIFYEDTPTDSAVAFSYKKRMEKDSFNIVVTRKIAKDSSRIILDMLLIPDTKLRDASSEEAKEEYGIKLDSIGHIFVASNNDLISSKVLSAVETRGDSIIVIGSADWLDLPVIKYEMYSKLGTILYAPLYNIKSNARYTSFRENYIRKHRNVPNKYVEIGYELMKLMGRSLDSYGKYFQLGWETKGYMEGYLTPGFDFANSNDNLMVPMLSFDNEDIHIIYERKNDD
ncbi:MAG TPA: ABC transporter substrate-binding protein [Fulvivirga sp.]|nr:ABC transporter substrate-binding protein [Fulvivirga sp.]